MAHFLKNLLYLIGLISQSSTQEKRGTSPLNKKLVSKNIALLAAILMAALFILLTLTLLPANTIQAAGGGISVRIIAAPNFVVDSNVESPSTYAPTVATIGVEFCNTGNQAPRPPSSPNIRIWLTQATTPLRTLAGVLACVMPPAILARSMSANVNSNTGISPTPGVLTRIIVALLFGAKPTSPKMTCG
jgi:hypothetical protein